MDVGRIAIDDGQTQDGWIFVEWIGSQKKDRFPKNSRIALTV